MIAAVACLLITLACQDVERIAAPPRTMPTAHAVAGPPVVLGVTCTLLRNSNTISCAPATARRGPGVSGTVHFEGRAYPSVSLAHLASRGLFYLPDYDLLSTAFSVRQQLEMLRAQFPGGNVVAAAARLGIEGRLDARPGALSGGERRRAELAAVLVRRPTCLLADEPFRGIAPKDAEDLTAVFSELARDGIAVVLTGHEVPTLLHVADHISWCTSGTTYELGPPAEARQHHAFQTEYLGPWAKS